MIYCFCPINEFWTRHWTVFLPHENFSLSKFSGNCGMGVVPRKLLQFSGNCGMGVVCCKVTKQTVHGKKADHSCPKWCSCIGHNILSLLHVSSPDWWMTNTLTVRSGEIWEGVVALLVLHYSGHHAAVVDKWRHTETFYQHVLKVIWVELTGKGEH
jgi:hypothetical protein